MKWETTGCAHAQKRAYGNGFVSGRTAEPRVFTARRTRNAARYRPAGTREALPGAMPFRFFSQTARACARLFVYCISFDGLKLKVFAKNSV